MHTRVGSHGQTTGMRTLLLPAMSGNHLYNNADDFRLLVLRAANLISC